MTIDDENLRQLIEALQAATDQPKDYNDMPYDWRRQHPDRIADQLKKEVQERRAGVRTFMCRNLFKAFGYDSRSTDAAERITDTLAKVGVQIEPDICRGPQGYELSTRDWVRLTQRPIAAPAAAKPAAGADFPAVVTTAGSGPYPESRFDQLLKDQGIQYRGLSDTKTAVLVLGRYDWDEDDLDAFIDSCRGGELRVYSQEMFLAYLATDEDPYDDAELLLAFGQNHPALDYLSEWGFDWPTTIIVPGTGSLDADHGDPDSWPQTGLLKHLGYSVGSSGILPFERHRILTAVFTKPVPNVQSHTYMAQWGEPLSGTRLQKLANSIATFARNAKRKATPPYQAITDWEADLSWLEETYYRGRFRFHWPSTHVY